MTLKIFHSLSLVIQERILRARSQTGARLWPWSCQLGQCDLPTGLPISHRRWCALVSLLLRLAGAIGLERRLTGVDFPTDSP